MLELNQIELQNLRNLIEEQEISYKKLCLYSTQCVDPQIKQMFSQLAQDALKTKNQLISYLN